MCNITNGLATSCEYVRAGNSTEVYLANVGGISVTLDSNNGVTALAGDFYKYEVSEDSLVNTDTLQIGGSQNRFYEHRVAFKYSGGDATARNAFESLGLANLIAVVKDTEGKYKLYGVNGVNPLGLRVRELVYNSGAAASDEFGFTIAMTQMINNLHYNLNAGLEPVLDGSVYNFE